MSAQTTSAPRLEAYTHTNCLGHQLFPGFLEKPERLEALLRDVFNGQSGLVLHADVAPASRAALSAVHDPAYVQRVAQLSAMHPLFATFSQLADKRLQWYTRVSPRSYDAARYAAGAVLAAVGDVAEGRVDRAFVAVRPPGHHAGPERGEGFCLFNNVAVGAVAARKAGFKRVAIVDFDRHHGNGTEAIVHQQNDAGLLLISSYQDGCKYAQDWPTGSTTLHVPIPAESQYAAVEQLYRQQVAPALKAFAPDLLMISAGFDLHESDPLTSVKLKSADYTPLTRLLVDAAAPSTQGRTISVLEGGYDRPALVACVRHHLMALGA